MKGFKVSLFYCIRDFCDYIPSRYCEQIKWQYFLEFDKYIEGMIVQKNDISWEFVCRGLTDLCESFGLDSPTIVSFEAIRGDIFSFLKFLTQCPPDSVFSKLKDSDIVFPDSFIRSSPQEAIDLAFQASSQGTQNLLKNCIKNLSVKVMVRPNMYLYWMVNILIFVLSLDQVYESNVSSLVTQALASLRIILTQILYLLIVHSNLCLILSVLMRET